MKKVNFLKFDISQVTASVMKLASNFRGFYKHNENKTNFKKVEENIKEK